MRTLTLSLAALLLCMGPIARADAVYQFSVNTSSISGTAGSLDFNFNPGPIISQSASLDVFNFASDGTLAGSPSLTGDVSGGPLPAKVTFDNGTAFNDYFEGFTYGSSLVFDVRLYGPAVNSPSGAATSGSTFAFSMFSDAAGTIPVLTTDTTNGFAATIDINLDGSTTVTNNSSETKATPVPEPSGLMLLGSGLAVFAGMIRRKLFR